MGSIIVAPIINPNMSKLYKTRLTKIQYETAIKEIDKKGQDGMNK